MLTIRSRGPRPPHPPTPRRGRRPPGPRARFPGALLVSFRRDPLGFLTTVARRYGDVAEFRLGPQRVVLLSHPEHVRDLLVTQHRRFHKGVGLQRAKHLVGEGLLTSEDELHQRQRRLIQPAFHHERIEACADLMAAEAERTAARWAELAAGAAAPRPLDVHREMQRLTLLIAGRALFHADLEAEADDIGRALATSLDSFRRFTMMPFASLLERLPLPAAVRFAGARRRLDAVIERVVAERRADGADRGDLLSMLLFARDETGRPAVGERQLRDELMTLLLAGHETTATALTWTWYLLARHPEVERRLHQEVDRVLGGSLPGAADLARLDYTRRVLAEAMRVYPPAWVLGRLAIGDYEVAGYRFPPGTLVLVSQWVLHRDPRFFPDPERFDPERWTEPERAARPKFAYFPFGGGPRGCIGEPFAWMEGVLVLATLARRWRLRLARDGPVALQPSVTLRPQGGMPMILEARS